MSAAEETRDGRLRPGWAAPAHRPEADPLTETALADRLRENLDRPYQRVAIPNAVDPTIQHMRERFAGHDHDGLREEARRIRAHAIANLPSYLEQWVDNAEANGTVVHYAADAADARTIVAGICAEEGVGRVVKSKSMASEEVSLNAALEDAGVDVYETDLGEFVVQAMGDRPSHVIAPILHRTQGEIHELFSAMAGEELPDDPAALTAFARAGLRHAFLTADAGISGGNLLIAETGEVVLVTNEGNARLTTSLPRVHIALVGIEKVIPRRRDLGVVLPLLTGHGTGQLITTYVTIAGGPRRAGEPDGPERMHVVLLDAGRSALLGSEYEDVLHCIRCGACQNACPVYRQVGGHAYGWVYGGPIGAVLTPLLRGDEDGGELPQVSSLCGACDDACPVAIPLHDLLLRLRCRHVDEAGAGWREQVAVRAWALLWRHPAGYRASTAIARAGLRGLARGGVVSARLPGLRRWTDGRDLIPGLRRR